MNSKRQKKIPTKKKQNDEDTIKVIAPIKTNNFSVCENELVMEVRAGDTEKER